MDEIQKELELESQVTANHCTSKTNEDYFIPALLDCWPRILNSVKRPQDLQSVMDTSNMFYDMVQTRVFTELIIPVLLHNEKYLGKEGILTCRQLNHEIKTIVDYTLRQVPHSWIEDHLESAEEIAWLIEDSEELDNRFPFMLRSFEIFSDNLDDIQTAVNLFQNFGQELESVKFYLPSDYQAGPLMTILIEALKNLPHLRTLHLILSGLEVDANEDTTMVEPIPPNGMPKLEKLTKMSMLVFSGEHGGDVPPPVTFVKSFIQAYGKQVTSFSSNGFIYDLGLGMEFFKVNLPNVAHYKVYDFDDIVAADDDVEDGTLSQVTWPKLGSLDIFSARMTFTTNALQVLTNFRTSLAEIRFAHLICDDVGVILEALQDDLPCVKNIILCPSNLDDPVVLEVFPRLFPNLEGIKFQPDYTHLNEPIPNLSVRSKYFENHPKLETFVWSECISYSRWIDNEFQKDDTLPFSRTCFTKRCS